ncbi:hypothetical protein Tco_0383074 [Tanacetum coccineum]
MTHPSPKRNMVPKAVLMRSGLVSLTTDRPVNTAQPKTTVNSTRPMTNVFNKAHSTVKRPINNKTTTKNNNFYQKVNTARPKAVLNAVKRNQCINHPKEGNPQQDLQEKRVTDSGSRHMTGNMSYLTDFEEIDGDMLPLEVTLKEGKSQAEDKDVHTIKAQKSQKSQIPKVSIQKGSTVKPEPELKNTIRMQS